MRTSLKHKIKTHLAACALAGMAFSGSALGAVVHSGPVNIAIPATTNGVYLDVVTGVNNTAASSVVGWDLNPWSSSGLGFFSPSLPAGGVYVLSAAATVGNLAPGASINAGSTFGAGTSANVAQWTLSSSSNLFGFRFQNEATGQIHYGWARIQLGTSITANRAIVEYAYEGTAGTAIAAGDTGVPAGSPSIGFTTATLAFGNVTVGTGSAAQTVTLSNTGTASGTAPTLSSSNAVFARTGGTCSAAPITLAAGASCTVAVTFSPVATGAVTGTLSFGTVPNNTPSGSASVALSGAGTSAGSPNIGFNTGTLAFGNVAVGSSSAPQTVTLANTGTASGTVPTLGTDSAAFAITGGTCAAAPFSLAAGASCTVAVTFSPSVVGAASGNLTIANVPTAVPSPNGTPVSVALSGTGTGGPGPGPGAEPVVATVPVNSTWALAALLGLFGLIAGVMLRRR